MATAKNQQKDFSGVVSQADVTANRVISLLTIWDGSDVSSDTCVAELDITDSASVKLGQPVRLPANIITFTIPTPTNGFAVTAEKALAGIIGTGLFVFRHYGAPGSSYNANIMTSIGNASVVAAEWTIE